MLPARNQRDLDEISADVRQKLEFIWLERVDDAMAAALEDPVPGSARSGENGVRAA